ncbi:MAG: RNA methyltransferase, partial [Lachnospiraceae bacterium]|nr:RNA methyltransferase [Lachnospiraceae bacterium]
MITSSSNEKIKNLAGLIAKGRERRESGTYVVEGIKQVLEAEYEDMVACYVSDELDREALQSISVRFRDKVEMVRDNVIDKVSDTRTPQGVIAIVKMRKHTIEEITEGERPFIVMLDRISDPGNMGTIIRTAEGAGVSGIIAGEGCVDIYNPKTVRSTMGSLYRVPVVTGADLEEAVSCLKEKGIKLIATHLDGRHSYFDEDMTGPCAVIIGSEAHGISDALAEAADSLIRIPMAGKLESRNASVAAALMMYEAARQ